MIDLLYWALAILLFGIVITIHELGHFWAARATGMCVMEFAVGMGPKIWSHKAKSGVLYSLRAFPLGGFCRFVGDDEESDEMPVAYSKEKIWKRALTSFSGPLMNYVFAFILLVVLGLFIGTVSTGRTAIYGVVPDSPASEAGLLAGDVLISINGANITSVDDASARIAQSMDETMLFGVDRQGTACTIEITPRFNEAEGRRMMGIEYGEEQVRAGFNLIGSIKNAFSYIMSMSRMIFDMIRDAIFKGEGTQNLSGPIGTVVGIKEQTQTGGAFTYISLCAMISVNLGLFNLLPIPGLDGSKLLFLLVEKIRGKRIDPGKEGAITLVGFGLLVVLMVVVMYQDIVRIIG